MGKAFNHVKELPDHPNLEKLLQGDEADFDPSVRKPVYQKDKKCNCKSLDVTNSKFHTNVRELLSQHRRNQFKMLNEFNQIEKMLDNREYKPTEQIKKARKKSQANPVAKLSNALH